MKIHLPFYALIFLFLLGSCESKTKKDHSINLADTTESTAFPEPPVEKTHLENNINNINFYFENSASMFGYLTGTGFKQTMHRILGNIDDDQLNSFFVNTTEHPTTNILRRIDNRNIRVGDISNSDHEFIFKNAIEKAVDNNLSIVITDGIYSVREGDVDIVKIDIEKAFRSALKDNEIETVILKLTSDFTGTYYSESCKPGHKAIRINQKRPYYIFLFGNKKVIDSALNEIIEIRDLPEFQEKARFFITKNLNPEYTILTAGEEKHGTFKQKKRGGGVKYIHEIIDAERFSRGMFSGTPKEENYLSFGIAVNLSDISLPETYLSDINNYEVDDDTGYQIVDIKKISDMSRNMKTLKLNKDVAKLYTHIITVKANKNLYGDLEIDLEINMPGWIKDTGLDDDCSIKGNETQTFAFDKLIKGIAKAYEKVNDKDEYIELKLKIKA